ncbi:glycosyltransferase family 2 protein [Chloroflexota bacterium]
MRDPQGHNTPLQPPSKHKRVLDRLLPWGTRRNYYYELVLIGIIVLRKEGWRSFLSKAIRTLKKHRPYHFRDPYLAWISKNEPDTEALERQRQESLSLRHRPLVSVITPVWNTGEKWLRLTIDSVINQTYDNWELCLVDGGSSMPHVRKVLEEYARKAPRIKVKFLLENKGISGNSNEAISMATGEFIVLLDHDDEMAPFALYECVRLLNEIPETDFIYSDEDKITDTGRRFEPFFKPDWSPDMFLSHIYTRHLGLYRKTIVDIIGGFRMGYDNSQEYDLVLRFIEKTSRIRHIPKVLYHWRSLIDSAASRAGAKPYDAYVSSRMAIGDYMARNAIKGKVVDGSWPGSYRVVREIIGYPIISIIIPTKDKVDILKRCIESILAKTEYSHYEILIVDNQSTELATHEYYEQIAIRPGIRVLHYDRPFNYSALNNWAVIKAQGEHLLLLNNDTEVISPGWLTAMLEHSQRPEVGVVGAKLLFPYGSIQHCGILLGIGAPQGFAVTGHAFTRCADDGGYFGRANIVSNYSAVTGACMMMRKRLFKEVGGFDENLSYVCNDIDLCLKIRERGYLVVYTPYAVLYHLEAKTRGYSDTAQKLLLSKSEKEYLRARWGPIIDKGDPYYNPNLRLDSGDFQVRT